MSTKPDTSTAIERAGSPPGVSPSRVPHAEGQHFQGLARATVCVLGGGRSGERAVSLRTQEGVLNALRSPELVPRPQTVLAAEVLADGLWCVEGQTLSPAAALVRLEQVDLFFLALHGGQGEDGTLQGLFEANDRAYTGSGVGASAVAMDKCFARILVSAVGLEVPPGRTIDGATWRSNASGTREDLIAMLAGVQRKEGAAWFVKPRSGGSSVATSWLRGSKALEQDLGQALEGIFDEDDEALVELAVEGVEVSVGVVQEPSAGDQPGSLRALTPIEIQPHAERFFDYTEKYRANGARELCPPVSVDEKIQERLKEQALLAHRTLRCSGYSRTDFIVPPDGAPVFLETNTLPGLMERSLLPQEAAQEGIGFGRLCQWILLDALERHRPGPDSPLNSGRSERSAVGT